MATSSTPSARSRASCAARTSPSATCACRRRSTPAAKSSQIPPLPTACQILNLSIAPINLNLLGLSVRTNQIDLRIEAVPGAGNLLGNLLCGITNLLNPGSSPLDQIAAALNAILALIRG